MAADVQPPEGLRAPDEIDYVILRALVDRRVEVDGPDFDYADESLTAYARSVRMALDRAGRLRPPGGEVSDSPRGLGNREYARRIAARLYRDLWQRKQGRESTAAHAQVLIEKELNAIAAEIWGADGPPVSSTGEEKTDHV